MLALMVGCATDAPAPEGEPEETVLAIFAGHDLLPGIPLTDDDLVATEVPARLVPEDARMGPERIVGQVPRARILANEVVRPERLVAPDDRDGQSYAIPHGHLALTVPVQLGVGEQGTPVSYELVQVATSAAGGVAPLLPQGRLVLGLWRSDLGTYAALAVRPEEAELILAAAQREPLLLVPTAVDPRPTDEEPP